MTKNKFAKTSMYLMYYSVIRTTGVYWSFRRIWDTVGWEKNRPDGHEKPFFVLAFVKKHEKKWNYGGMKVLWGWTFSTYNTSTACLHCGFTSHTVLKTWNFECPAILLTMSHLKILICKHQLKSPQTNHTFVNGGHFRKINETLWNVDPSKNI